MLTDEDSGKENRSATRNSQGDRKQESDTLTMTLFGKLTELNHRTTIWLLSSTFCKDATTFAQAQSFLSQWRYRL